MCAADVTAISLVTDLAKDRVCAALVPRVSSALTHQGIAFERMPVTRDYMDWVLNGNDKLTVALDSVDGRSIILIASSGRNAAACAAQLANIAAEMCHDFDAHTIFWNGSDVPIPARDFLGKERVQDRIATRRRRVFPRKVSAGRPGTRRTSPLPSSARLENWVMRGLRTKFTTCDQDEIDRMELELRRSKPASLRLAAWALSLTVAIFALPLAIPLFVHNLMRGEDLRAGGLALGVAGLFTSLASSGMAPQLMQML